jgi:hypothetical protein
LETSLEFSELISKKEFVISVKFLQSSPVTGLEWPRGFQEVKVPRFHDNGTGW